MEKRFEKNINIAITGPESTGKTTLTRILAEHFKGGEISEYARDYIFNLNRAYTISDLVHIAKYQIDSYKNLFPGESGIVFFDTWLIITKIWFQEVYSSCPDWVVSAIDTYKMEFYLVCAPDIEWHEDPVRENGGEKRLKLFDLYIEEIQKLNVPYKIIYGEGQQRSENAIKAVEDYMQ